MTRVGSQRHKKNVIYKIRYIELKFSVISLSFVLQILMIFKTFKC